MSKTSAEYQAGFAKLLPHVSSPRDIRAPGNEALAWQALVAAIAYDRDGSKFMCPCCYALIDGSRPTDTLYAAIEAIGRMS